MNDAQKVIAETLRVHQYNGADLGHHGPRVEYCTCGWSGPGEQVHEDHQAHEIDTALGGLTGEERTNPMSSAGMTTNYNTGEVVSFSDIRRDVRWVSGWREVVR